MPIRIDGDKVTEEIKNMHYINWIQILTLKHQIPLSLWGEIVGLKLELSVKSLAGYEKRERGPTKKYLQNSVSMVQSEQKRVDPIKAISGGKMKAFVRINRMETLDLLCLDGVFVVGVTSNGGG